MPISSIDELLYQAVLCFEQNQLADAVRHASEIVRRQADHGPATRLLGRIAHRLGDYQRAERLLRKALGLGQESPELLDELGRLFADQDQWEKASRCYEQSLKLFPAHSDAFINLAYIKNAQQDYAAAQEIYRRGIAAFPNSIEIWTNFSTLHRENGSLDAAIELIDEIIKRFGESASLRESRARALLQLRRWPEGWQDYEARLEITGGVKPVFNTEIPRWNGETLAEKRVLVLCEQGIGDEVQFASCFPELIRQVSKCTLTCSPRLDPIYRRSFPSTEVLALTDQDRLMPQPMNVGAYDAVIAAGSLPKLLRQTDDSFPGKPFLRADDTVVNQYRSESLSMRVGVSWWGGSIVSQMKQRSVPFEAFSRLFSTPNVQFVNLQHGRCDERTAKDELAVYPNLKTYYDLNPYVDLDSWFNLIASLDLVITVDNSNAHFAGALGVPTWLMLPDKPNWRWPYDLTQSNWYNCVQFFRRRRGGNWVETIEKICNQLAQITGR